MKIFHLNHDFGTETEIHFHATASGKGPCDGVGGNVNGLYEEVKALLLLAVIHYSKEDEILQYGINLKIRFESVITIPGTKKCQGLFPTIQGMMIKQTSECIT